MKFESTKALALYKTVATLVIILVAILLFWLIHRMTSPPTPKPTAYAIIDITSSGFVPKTIAVSRDTEIIWLNTDSARHLPVADPGQTLNFGAPKALNHEQTYRFLFTQAEVITYHDALHSGLTGTIEVK